MCFLGGRLKAPFTLHQPPTQCGICGLLFPRLLEEEQKELRGIRKGGPGGVRCGYGLKTPHTGSVCRISHFRSHSSVRGPVCDMLKNGGSPQSSPLLASDPSSSPWPPVLGLPFSEPSLVCLAADNEGPAAGISVNTDSRAVGLFCFGKILDNSTQV